MRTILHMTISLVNQIVLEPGYLFTLISNLPEGNGNELLSWLEVVCVAVSEKERENMKEIWKQEVWHILTSSLTVYKLEYRSVSYLSLCNSIIETYQILIE